VGRCLYHLAYAHAAPPGPPQRSDSREQLDVISIVRVLADTVTLSRPVPEASVIHIMSPARNGRLCTLFELIDERVPLPNFGFEP
jgi:hypothetical protein